MVALNMLGVWNKSIHRKQELYNEVTYIPTIGTDEGS